MNDLATFHKLSTRVNGLETQRSELKTLLDETYDQLVKICPHYEAIDNKSGTGRGTRRRCVICGVTDYASEGGTPGDEYDHGYPGSPNREFWKGAEIRVVDDKEFNSYGRSHYWRVKDGKAVKGVWDD